MKNPYISVVGRKKLPTVNDIIMNVRSCRAVGRYIMVGNKVNLAAAVINWWKFKVKWSNFEQHCFNVRRGSALVLGRK